MYIYIYMYIPLHDALCLDAAVGGATGKRRDVTGSGGGFEEEEGARVAFDEARAVGHDEETDVPLAVEALCV
jgi:hypothetical protein